MMIIIVINYNTNHYNQEPVIIIELLVINLMITLKMMLATVITVAITW